MRTSTSTATLLHGFPGAVFTHYMAHTGHGPKLTRPQSKSCLHYTLKMEMSIGFSNFNGNAFPGRSNFPLARHWGNGCSQRLDYPATEIHKRPLVDGIPVTRESGEMAVRNARPNPLKAASAI